MQTYQYTYIVLAIVVFIFGYFHTGRHLRPRWKIAGRMLMYLGGATVTVVWLHHFSLMFIIGYPVVGLILHTQLCEKNGIDWWTCEPVEKFAALRNSWGSWDV
jgi:hypothetical protein